MAQEKSKTDSGTILLLALIVMVPAFTVASSDWAPGLDMLLPTALAGLALGVLVARSSFRSRWAHLLALGYGAVWVAFVSIEYLPRAVGIDELGARILAFGQHVGEWIWLLLQTGVGKDNFIFLLSLLTVFWLLGYLAAWYTFRLTKVLRVVLPSGLVILVNLYYYGGRMQLSIFLYLYFVFALLYLARVHYMLREREWRRSRVGFDADVRGSFVRGGSIVTLVAVAVAWVVPEIAPMPPSEDLWRLLSRPIRSIEDSFNRLFSSLEGQGPVLTNPFGRALGFGGPRQLGDTVLMDVYVYKSEDNANALARYWRAGAYDTYTSNGWISSDSQTFPFAAKSDPLVTPYQMRSNVRQAITFYFPLTSLLIATSQPVYFSRDGEADAQLITSSGATGAQGAQVFVDPSFVTSHDLLRAGDNYEAVSAVSIADVDKLRAAGADYPDWIRKRYLQLPDNFPQRVKELAQQIAADAGATTPFDQATALERWLRQNITYNEKIAGPDLGQDGVDYVLFVSQAGYCDYYASAMVTMARSLGIPARVVVGYARGEYLPSGDVYRVRERNAHMWVEVFFPNYGWIEFEPTAVQPLVSRPVSDTSQAQSDPAPPPTPSVMNIDDLRQLEGAEDKLGNGSLSDVLGQALPRSAFMLAGLLVIGTVVAIGTIYVVENRGLKGLRGTRWAYARLVRLARWLRVDVGAHQTPFEQAELLARAAPGSRNEISAITGDFVRETFGRDESGANRARLTWRQTHLRLWGAGLKRRVVGVFSRFRRSNTPRRPRFSNLNK
ncbi:MAG TPA: transglutaminase domain-containing protein [Anaerolineae bacterium]